VASKTTDKKETGYEADTAETPEITLPYNDWWVRIGLGHELELGVKYTVPTGIGADLKWRLVHAGLFSLAIDPGAHFHSFIFLHRADVDLPILASLDFGEHFKMYGGARVFYSYWSCSVNEECDRDLKKANSVAFGGFFGISIEFWKVFIRPEVHYYRMEFPGLDGGANIVQPSIGIGVRFGGPSPRPKFHQQPQQQPPPPAGDSPHQPAPPSQPTTPPPPPPGEPSV
jgi:opacity protein-like surface antigen